VNCSKNVRPRAATGATTRRENPANCRRVRVPYAPFPPAWLHGTRMVERVGCAGGAGNARRVRTPVRTSVTATAANPAASCERNRIQVIRPAVA
jgi:hypothetical protein